MGMGVSGCVCVCLGGCEVEVEGALCLAVSLCRVLREARLPAPNSVNNGARQSAEGEVAPCGSHGSPAGGGGADGARVTAEKERK